MIDRKLEKRIARLIFGFMAAVALLIILTSCNPYEGLAAPTVSIETPTKSTATQAPTASPTPTKPGPDLCTVRTGIPAGYLNLRTGPGMRYAVLRILDEGDKLKVLERAAWLRVIDARGRRGYINSKYCR